jgi:hyperosmotically inducible protein
MSNDDLDRTVTAKINSDATLAAYNIDVDADADKNAVTLSGSVPNEGLRDKAVQLAKSGNAALTVTDKIDVKPLDADRKDVDVDRRDYTPEMATTARARAKESGESIGSEMDDAWIHTKIRAKLAADGELPGTGIKVDVNNNVVTLRGSVEKAADKANAEQIAKSTEGVKTVRNQIVVKP